MSDFLSRTELLIGKANLEKLGDSGVIVFGAGGVGSYVVEALVRCGVGKLGVVDNDKINPSNLNRQIIATTSSLGQFKVDAVKNRALDINPNLKINTYNIFYTSENKDCIDFKDYDYIVDAIDTVSGKLILIEQAKKHGIPIICSMGTGNKIHPEMFEVADISKTSVCPLARVMRTELKKRNIKDVKVVYSKELPIVPNYEGLNIKPENNKFPPSSISFVPASAGLIIAGEVIRDLIGYEA